MVENELKFEESEKNIKIIEIFEKAVKDLMRFYYNNECAGVYNESDYQSFLYKKLYDELEKK